MGEEVSQYLFWDGAGMPSVVRRQHGTVSQTGHFGLISPDWAQVPKSQSSLFYESLIQSQLFLLFISFLLALYPDCHSQLEEEESAQTTLDASILPSSPPVPRQELLAAATASPGSTGSCLFWHVVTELVRLTMPTHQT